MANKDMQIPGAGKKRTYDQHANMIQVSALQLGQTFKSKGDFHEYLSQRGKVSTLYQHLADQIGYSCICRPSHA